MKEYEKPQETLKNWASIGLVALAFTGCGMAINENQYIYTDVSVIPHEQRHQEQIRYMGGAEEFWRLWFSDPEFRCAVEIDAGIEPEAHFGCNGVEYDNWDTNYVQEIIISRRP